MTARITADPSTGPSSGPGFLGRLTFEPLSRSTWDRFVALFGQRGACGNCWCMSFRLAKKAFEHGKQNNGNKRAMKKLVWSGKTTGILALLDGQPIGWCALSPREDFARLEYSRVHRRIDDKPVWSIPCFFVKKEFRGKGVSVALLRGAIAYARSAAIPILEAYPAIPTRERLPDAFAWIGLYRSFQRAGFVVVDRTSRSRPMVRYNVDDREKSRRRRTGARKDHP